MGNLFLSFTIAICASAALVTLSKTFGLDIYTSRIFPLIPILYAIIYEVLEKNKKGRSKPIPPARAKEEMKAGARVLFQNITPGRIVMDVTVSFGIKCSVEILLVALFFFITGQTFSAIYGNFGIETVGRFLRGDHPWLEGSMGIAILGLIALLASFGTGMWIGHTSEGQAMLEGVIAGAAVTFITAMTSMLILYRGIEEAANKMTASFGYGHIGFVLVLVVQVLLYGLFSGFSQQSREERILRSEFKKSPRKAWK